MLLADRHAAATCARARVTAAATAILLLAATSTHSQELVFDHLSVEQGLSSSWVHVLAKDSRGFLWIGTQNGLDRFDGQRIVSYPAKTEKGGSLTGSRIQAIYEDAAGRFWVGTASGLNRYDREHDRFTLVSLAGTQGSDNIDTIQADARGRLWLATGRGLVILDPETGTSQVLSPVPVGALLIDRKGRVWVATDAGVRQLDAETGAPIASSGPPVGLSAVDLREDRQGRIWVSSRVSGLTSIDPASGRATRYLPDRTRPGAIQTLPVTCTASDEGHVYVGTENGGIEVLDLATGRFTRYMPRRGNERSLGSASIYSIFVDDQQMLWVGTYNAGVSFTSDAQRRFGLVQARREDELSDAHVMAIMEDRRGELWVGTDGGGLNRFPAGGGRTIVYRHDAGDPTTIGSDAILAVLEDRDGAGVWLGGWGAGLGLLDPRSGRVTNYRHTPSSNYDHVYSVQDDGPRTLIVASAGGVERFDRFTRTFSPIPFSGGKLPSWVTALARDAAGNLWLGAGQGALYLERDTNRLVAYPPARAGTSPALGPAFAFLLDSRRNFWIGFDKELHCRPADGSPARIWTKTNGLAGNSIKGLLEDEAGNVWVSTERGLSRIEAAVQLPHPAQTISFDPSDGLQGLEFRNGAAFKSRTGELFFGGQKGFNRFQPARIKLNQRPPAVVLTGLRLFNEPVGVGTPGSPLQKAMPELRELTLSHRQAVVTFEFAALNFVLPAKNQYEYKLEPLETKWNAVGRQNSANYALAPNRYVFRVRAANNDGVWNDQGTSLAVQVTPPWWMTWWFRLLAVVALAAAFATWYRSRVRAMAERHKQLEALVAERTGRAGVVGREPARPEPGAREENVERKRAEAEARRAAEQIAHANDSLEEQRAGLEREVSERKRAEQEAGRERDLLHALMDNAPTSSTSRTNTRASRASTGPRRRP